MSATVKPWKERTVDKYGCDYDRDIDKANAEIAELRAELAKSADDDKDAARWRFTAQINIKQNSGPEFDAMDAVCNERDDGRAEDYAEFVECVDIAMERLAKNG